MTIAIYLLASGVTTGLLCVAASINHVADEMRAVRRRERSRSAG